MSTYPEYTLIPPDPDRPWPQYANSGGQWVKSCVSCHHPFDDPPGEMVECGSCGLTMHSGCENKFSDGYLICEICI